MTKGEKKYTVKLDDSFEKKLLKHRNRVTEKQNYIIDDLLELFVDNPFDPRLKTHKLKGRLKDFWAFSINYSDRIVFRFIDENTLFLIDIGNHDDIY